MTAAITAARLGHEVTLYERQARAGRKLMATGNGRCNLTNTGAGPSNYHGEAPDFVRPALEAFPSEAALDFFRGLGLLAREEWGGRVYPLSNSANSVVDVRGEAQDAAGGGRIGGGRAGARAPATPCPPRAATSGASTPSSSPAAASRARSWAEAVTATSS